MNTKAILAQVDELYRKAKDGSVKIDDLTYFLKFDRNTGLYLVTCSDSSAPVPLNLNTRKLSEAKKWLKEWLQN